MPGDGARRVSPHLTSVVRVPAGLAQTLADATHALPGAAGHYLYPHGDLHLTVLNVDAARQPRLAERVEAVAAALAPAAPFPVVLAGLGVSRWSVYARAYDPAGSLWRLRAQVADATGSRPPLPLRLLGFVNVLRFVRPEVGELLAGLAPMRRVPLGVFDVAAVEVVRTDRVLSAAGTEMLRRVVLAGR